MIVRSLDANGDWNFGKGKNDYVQANAAIAVLVKTRLQAFTNDCFFDIASGLDWFNLLGSKNKSAIRAAVSTTILNTYGVTGITELSANLDSDRNLTITYTITTIFPGGITGDIQLLLDELGNVLTDESGDPLHA